MKDFKKLDQLLWKVISSDNEPENSLNQKIISEIGEKNRLKRVSKKRISATAVFAILIVITSTSVFAAWHLLTPKQVAENFGNKGLAIAFEGKDALSINQTQISGNYEVTLLGIVSGKEISNFNNSSENIYLDRTYAVVAIAKADGTSMPSLHDPEYDEVSFIVSPFIKGQDPKDINIFTMNGGYSGFIKDGIMYRIVECDDIEIFADRGLYLGVISNTFYDINAYDFDLETGEINRNTDYEGINLLFDLPLDSSKGNYEKAEKYLQTLSINQETPDEELIDIEALLKDATLIPESVHKAVPDEDGMITYYFDGHELKTDMKNLFKEGQVGFSDSRYIEDENILVFSRDTDWVITVMVYRKK